jgi:DNA-binding FadR family transcriptional regulator
MEGRPVVPTRVQQKRSLVSVTADKLRDLVFTTQPNDLIGSLQDLAKSLQVGIVTMQQAARILEHEGLLEVRRGPGGGYYGTRPNAAALERSLAAYMRSQPASWQEALDITSLLFNELSAAAAGCRDPTKLEELRKFARAFSNEDDELTFSEHEAEFQELLFRMVDRPLFELLSRVTMRFSEIRPINPFYNDPIKIKRWAKGRLLIIDAILRNDAELAWFEANRNNRLMLLDWL